MSVEVVPLLLNERQEPRNPRLYEMAKAYVGGRDEVLNKPMVWVALAPDGANGNHPKVVGVACVGFIADATFHTDSPEATMRLFRRASERMADSGFDGASALVYIEPGKAELWKPLLERLKAEPADRWTFRLAGIEV